MIAVIWYAAIVGPPLLMFFWLVVHVFSDHIAEKRFAAELAAKELAENADTALVQDLRPRRKVARLVSVIRQPGARARSRARNAEHDEHRQRQAA